MKTFVRSNEWKRLSRDPFSGLFNDWNNLHYNPIWRSTLHDNRHTFAVDISETDTEYKLLADLPGISKENLEVTFKEGLLYIAVRTQEESQQETEQRVLRRERYQGEISRSFKLSDLVDDENIQANYKDGVLKIIVPKKAESQPRKIQVTVH